MTGILGLPMNAHEQELDKSDVQTYFEENNLLFSGWMNLTAFAENTVEEPDWAIAYIKRYEALEKYQEI